MLMFFFFFPQRPLPQPLNQKWKVSCVCLVPTNSQFILVARVAVVAIVLVLSLPWSLVLVSCPALRIRSLLSCNHSTFIALHLIRSQQSFTSA